MNTSPLGVLILLAIFLQVVQYVFVWINLREGHYTLKRELLKDLIPGMFIIYFFQGIRSTFKRIMSLK